MAIKVLPPERVADPDRKRRFVQEAKAASALSHPNIITIYDIDADQGMDFIAMEFVDGRPLDRLIAEGRPALQGALEYAVQIASALTQTHAAGILHRDLKPSNIMVTDRGLVKVLDFGLAKLTEAAAGGAASTQTLVIAGSPGYLAPEQLQGEPADARSDIFAFGCVLYELFGGRRAFPGATTAAALTATMLAEPEPLTGVPEDVAQVVRRMIAKDPGARYQSAAELHKDLSACLLRVSAPEVSLRAALQRPGNMIAALALLALLLAGAGWFGVRSYRSHWARTVALPEIARLVDQEKYVAAFRMAKKVDGYAPDDPELQRVRRDIWTPISIHTDPPGADVFIRDYAADRNDWEPVGKSPLEKLRLPAGYFCIRIAKPGFEEVEGTFNQFVREFRRTLQPAGASPPGMVFVPIDTFTVPSAGAVKAGSFWLDKYEVTNRQFKEFVDRGGYRKREYWKYPFVEKGKTLSWEEAMAKFVDSTGVPGPSTWEVGSFPQGHEDYPVGGVSWYEAAAYADFVGKNLPTVYHWAAAADLGDYSTILQLSNFEGEGPARVGSYRGVGQFGTYDMAGNVTEWCWNTTADRRCVRGGAWPDPNYMYRDLDAASPFERGPTRGFRCAKYAGPLPETLTGPLASRPAHEDKPVGDDVFRSYKSIYAYDRADLKSRIESVDDASPWWRRERVTFDAAYGNERVISFVFLPRNAAPPYQTILYFPGATAQRERTSDNLELRRVDFLVRSGHAVVYPVYKGTYERYLPSKAAGPNDLRDLRVQWAKDVGRSLDYIETRADLDRAELAFFGVSIGASFGSMLPAIEPRFKTSILESGGLYTSGPFAAMPGEAQPINFLPRAKIPVFMLNGKDDFIFPLEQSQNPMFRLLGAPDKDKRHALLDSGHALPRAEVIKEVLAWLDRYLGPVKLKEP